MDAPREVVAGWWGAPMRKTRWGEGGVCLGPVVIYWRPPTDRCRRHEVNGHHALQYRPLADKYGVVGGTIAYLCRILSQYARHGHENAPWEIQARSAEDVAA